MSFLSEQRGYPHTATVSERTINNHCPSPHHSTKRGRVGGNAKSVTVVFKVSRYPINAILVHMSTSCNRDDGPLLPSTSSFDFAEMWRLFHRSDIVPLPSQHSFFCFRKLPVSFALSLGELSIYFPLPPRPGAYPAYPMHEFQNISYCFCTSPVSSENFRPLNLGTSMV